ncbi:BTAD domain-containing putative transcriptional regulator [Jeotgalibacillus terrae]|uniref:BTAD domain-containing putative transcriptional regulator n=1 Tax=Jeotgalibacillus terrae TaxID=587735 RepID=A0ABW5ZJS3_9BACL|nr:BTAD domain-containing putative transcriptional regulator [Jeotgalibacillus terrae]MBM7579681.1 ATP/maltotriose-dependent transcriptional regulator MalT/DNA-binding SARP family transcriptional activator [Jeotgalibacillus terrae]
MNTPILESKIKAPATYSSYLRRAAVSAKLKQLYRSPLTLIHSGAGYGKTSLLSHVLQDEKRLYSWYTAQEDDDDIQPFLLYLMASIERVLPGVDSDFSEKRTLPHYPKPSDLQNWVTSFIEALAPIDEEFVIVIDDFHTIDHVFSINFFMEKVISLLPDTVHIVLCSRQKPRWSNLLKLRSAGQLVEISSDDLQFKAEEIRYFYEDTHQLQLTDEAISDIYRVTEGWAIAIQLIGSYLAGSGESDFSLPDLPTDELFQFLAQEVVGKRSTDEQLMLYQLSLTESFDLQVIEYFYKEKGKRLLKEMLHSHMFVHQIGASHYRFHALFHQFLQDTFQAEMPEAWLLQHQQLADYYAGRNNVIQAMNHYRVVNNQQQMAERVNEFGPQLIARGQFDYLEDLLNQVPDRLKNSHYSLYHLAGEVYRYKAYYEKAKAAYLECAERARVQKDIYTEAKCMIGIASIYIDTIQPLYAEPYLDSALTLAGSVSDFDPEMIQEWKCLRIENLVNLGQAEEAEHLMERFGMRIEDLPAHNTDVRLHLRRGRLEEARATVLSKKQQTAVLPEMFREGTILGSFIRSMLGEADDALTLAERGVEHGRDERSTYIEAVGYVRKGHAHMISPVRELDEAHSCYRKSIELLTTYDLNRAKAEPLMGLAAVLAMQGLIDQSAEAYDAAIRETEKVQDNWLSAYLLIGRGHLRGQQSRTDEAVQDFKEALERFLRCGDRFGEFITRYYLQTRHFEQTSTFNKEDLEKLADLFLTESFDFFFKNHSLFGPVDPAETLPFWYEAAKELSEGKRQKIYRRLGLTEELRPPSYTLHVRLLGAFHVARGTLSIPEKEWRREKAKELFALFVLNRTRYLNKQEIYDELWPEVGPEQAERDFKVTYNAMLKAIEPEREARRESYFIERKGLLYRIRPDVRILVDTEQWQSGVEKSPEIKDPKLQLRVLKKTVSLYQGELFGERVPDSKSIRREQEQFHQSYLEVMERIAQLYTRLQDYHKVIYWAEKILAEDITWEEAYRLLMFAYYQKKNRRRAMELYSSCERVLREELGVSPMETTENMYDLIRL